LQWPNFKTCKDGREAEEAVGVMGSGRESGDGDDDNESEDGNEGEDEDEDDEDEDEDEDDIDFEDAEARDAFRPTHFFSSNRTRTF
jgi:hypothetical protein